MLPKALYNVTVTFGVRAFLQTLLISEEGLWPEMSQCIFGYLVQHLVLISLVRDVNLFLCQAINQPAMHGLRPLYDWRLISMRGRPVIERGL